MLKTPLRHFADELHIPCQSEKSITSVAIDSRKIEPGALFFALPGARVDGHSFLHDVAAKGAIAAIVNENYHGESFGLELLKVPNVILALQDLARKKLQRSTAKIVAITGSIGKTTTKEFTAKLLESSFKVAKSPLSYNSKLTLPLSILMSCGDEDIFVLEMGMTDPGDIHNLVSIAPPDIAVVTTIALQHAINFQDGLFGIGREKSAIFSHPRTQLGIFHHDVAKFLTLGNHQHETFSLENTDANYYFKNNQVITKNETIPITLHLPIPSHAQNFLAATAVARALGVSWENIQAIAPTLRLPPQRFEFIEKKGIQFINDAFNANPDATKAALENIPPPKKNGKKIAVLTEMNALGNHTLEGHTSVAEAALNCVDLLLCLGKNCEIMEKIWQKNSRPVFRCETKKELLLKLKEHAATGDIVLLKGARAYALEDVLAEF